MERLSDERVKQIEQMFDPNYADDVLCNGAGDGYLIAANATASTFLNEGMVAGLAREVLELREEVAELRKRDFLALAREGGLARTRNQTPERLSEIGRKGGKARAAGRKAESNDA